MDQPGLDADLHARALRGLGRINRLSGSAAILWPAIAALCTSHPGRTIRVLDLATGGGDVPIDLAIRAARNGLDLRIEGCDISPVAVEFAARGASRAGVTVSFFPLDALADPLPGDLDVVMCSLFLHHLADDEAARLLGKMAGAAHCKVLVNDLRRSRLGYWLACAGCRLLSRSPIVHRDGPASVRAAFTMAEARGLAERAGLDGVRVEPRWPRRFLLSWSRQAS
jgi:SAM-dependent methyltransferase